MTVTPPCKARNSPKTDFLPKGGKMYHLGAKVRNSQNMSAKTAPLKPTLLHQYQRKAIHHIINNPQCALFMQMGLGKSISTLSAFVAIQHKDPTAKALIVAPKRVADATWRQEAEKWEHTQHLQFVSITGTPAQRAKALNQDADIYLISRDTVAWLCDTTKRLPFSVLVIDELSSFKNPRSLRFKALKRRRKEFTRIIGLTGTPTPNGLMDLWAQMFLIDGGEALGKYLTHYRQTYFKPANMNRQTGVVYKYAPKPNAMQEISDRLTKCLSMKTEDYIDLPPVIMKDIRLQLTAPELAKYKELERDMCMKLQGEEITTANAATLVNKLRQYTAGAVYTEEHIPVPTTPIKREALQEIFESEDTPLLVGYEFQHETQTLNQVCKGWRRLQTAQDVQDWNSGNIPMAAGHPASIGHGLNLQAGGNRMAWLTPPWSLELYEQFNARLARQGQTKPVIIYRLIVEGTVDETVIEMLDSKANTQTALMDAVKTLMAKHNGNQDTQQIQEPQV